MQGGTLDPTHGFCAIIQGPHHMAAALVAHQFIKAVPRPTGGNQGLIKLARMGDRSADSGGGNLAVYHPLRLLQPQGLL